MLTLKNVKKIYNTKNEKIIANDNINFVFNEHGFYVILGKSGCGKTTMLNIIAGIDKYDDGQICLDDDEIGNYNNKELDEYRNIRAGVIFQQFNLISDMNVYDNLKVVLDIQQLDVADKEYDAYVQKQIEDILMLVGLSGYEKRKISELSGGEQQRIAIARTLLKQPDVILADEPTGNLDSKTGHMILELLKEISKNHLVIMVTHDKKSAYDYADVILKFKDGKIEDVVDNKHFDYKYSFVMNVNTNKIAYQDIDEDEMVKIFRERINGEASDLIIKDIVRKEINHENEQTASELNTNGVKKGTKKLKSKYKLYLSFQFLKKRKIRLLFTTIIFTLTAMLMYFSAYISFYDRDKIVTMYMDKYKPDLLPVNKNVSYVDDFFYTQENTLTKGKIIDSDIKEKEGKYFNKALTITDQDMSSANGYIFNASFIAIDKSDCPKVSKGRKLENKNEVVLTDYIADELGAEVGDSVEILFNEFKVVGIIKTDYKEYNLSEKLNYGYGDEFFDYDCKYYYFATYFLKDSLNTFANSKNFIEFCAADIFQTRNYEMYMSSYASYASDSDIKQEDLLYGKMPTTDNEILVSENYADENGLTEQDLGTTKYKLKDLYLDKFKGYYDDYLNMYDYFDGDIIITGIVKDDEEKMSEKDIYIDSEKFQKIKEDYYNYYFMDAAIVPDKDMYEELVNYTADKGITIDNPAVMHIDEFEDTLDSIKQVLYLIMIAVILVNVILIATFIGISVNENNRNIGILRAIGVSMKDCIKIFNVEFLIIYIVSMVVATAGVVGVIRYINNLFMKNFAEVKFEIIALNIMIGVIILITEYVVGKLSSYIPIGRLKKTNLIDIIKRTE